MSELKVFVKVNVVDAVVALAGVANKVADPMIALGDRSGLADSLSREVVGLSGRLFQAGTSVRTEIDGPHPRLPERKQKRANACKKAKAALAVKATPVVAKATPFVSPDNDKAKKPGYSVQGVCVVCGRAYLKRSPVQKTCSAVCTAEKNRAYARSKYAEKAEASPASADRLARIKAVDKKLDTIPS